MAPCARVLPGQRIRVYYSGDKPVAIDPAPLPAAHLLRSPLLATTQAMALAAPLVPRSTLPSSPNALLSADLGQLSSVVAAGPAELTLLEPVTITQGLAAVSGGQKNGGAGNHSNKGNHSSKGGQGGDPGGQGDVVTPEPTAPPPPPAPTVPPPILMPLGPGYPP